MHAEPAPRTDLNRPLVLIGLMGVGKTTVGRRLAQRLQLPFVDSDREIEAAAGMTITEIFERFGEGPFRDGERRVIAAADRRHAQGDRHRRRRLHERRDPR
jgi:shikimate kinase